MNTCELVMNFLINLLAGVVGILIVLWIEGKRRPFLTLSIGKPGEINKDDPLKRQQSKWLHIQVHNRNVPKWLSRVYHGEPALTCRAWITFYDLEGNRIFENDMVARWSGSDEPKIEVLNTQAGQIMRLVGAQNSFDIPPGENTDIDVVFRAASETNCYGWNNESYLHNWRHPNWNLGKGKFIAKVRIKTGGHEFRKQVLIMNDSTFDNFRLEEIQQ